MTRSATALFLFIIIIFMLFLCLCNCDNNKRYKINNNNKIIINNNDIEDDDITIEDNFLSESISSTFYDISNILQKDLIEDNDINNNNNTNQTILTCEQSYTFVIEFFTYFDTIIITFFYCIISSILFSYYDLIFGLFSFLGTIFICCGYILDSIALTLAKIYLTDNINDFKDYIPTRVGDTKFPVLTFGLFLIFFAFYFSVTVFEYKKKRSLQKKQVLADSEFKKRLIFHSLFILTIFLIITIVTCSFIPFDLLYLQERLSLHVFYFQVWKIILWIGLIFFTIGITTLLILQLKTYLLDHMKNKKTFVMMGILLGIAVSCQIASFTFFMLENFTSKRLDTLCHVFRWLRLGINTLSLLLSGLPTFVLFILVRRANRNYKSIVSTYFEKNDVGKKGLMEAWTEDLTKQEQ